MKTEQLVLCLAVLFFALFLSFQATGIYTGDTGDVVTAAFLFGVPHPPGYPLYSFIVWLLTRIPFVTPAWMAALASSIPHALTLFFLYRTVYVITKRHAAGIFAMIVAAGNYLYFLYSVTPEVFALFDLFVAVIMYLTVRLIGKYRESLVVLLALVVGLSLTHHHLVLFLLPGVLYGLLLKRHHDVPLRLTPALFTRLSAAFGLGLFPYVYVFVAARGSSIINWNQAVTIRNFIRLVTRADYGTFQSGAAYGQSVAERLVNVKAYGVMAMLDLTPVGVILAAIGLLWLWRTQRGLFQTFLMWLLTLGPFFFFYASFPIINSFMVGTYERFMLPTYTLAFVLIGLGVHALLSASETVLASKRLRALWSNGLYVTLLVYPVTILVMTIWRMGGLPDDRTAERLGRDVLGSVPRGGGLLLLSRDTTLFTTQYVRYVLGYRTDVIVLHGAGITDPEYQRVVIRNFPSVVFPESSDATFIPNFVRENAAKMPLYTNMQLAVPEGWYLVPEGLLYRVTPVSSAPDPKKLISVNEALWLQYQNPLRGVLSRYRHLMLSDVAEVYTSARVTLGKTLVRAGELKAALLQFEQAISLGGTIERVDAFTYAGVLYALEGRCDDALKAFERAQADTIRKDPKIGYYQGLTYRDCFGDPQAAQKFFDEYREATQEAEIQLQEL